MKAYLANEQRDHALRQYARCVEALQRELDVEPSGDTMALAAEIRASSTTSAPAIPLLGERIYNLPIPPNLLIGRVRELETLEDLLLNRGERLITLTGPGGIGKTRLALEAARNAAEEFAAGVCFVDLSTLSESDFVIPTILRTIGLDEVPGVPAMQVLLRSLGESEMLLVLDNLEQVIEAAGEIGTFLASCPGITILATSRQPLRLRAERVIATPPLAVPPASTHAHPDQRGTNFADRYEAVSLFVERARAIRQGFEITDSSGPAIAALCARLDGLPLAVELAAARSQHLNPVEMLAQLEPRLPMLTGGPRDLPARQRTLRDAIAWSYELLADPEKILFRRISVFSGDFGNEAVQGIFGSPGAEPQHVTDTVWDLADKNLLQRQEGQGEGAVRYKMLETIREFGLEHLATSGENDPIRHQHAAWYLALVEHAEPLLHGPDQISWLEQLEQEHDNLRSALEWACESREAGTALRLSGALAEYWRMTGHVSEGRAWLERALSLADRCPLGFPRFSHQGSGTSGTGSGRRRRSDCVVEPGTRSLA